MTSNSKFSSLFPLTNFNLDLNMTSQADTRPFSTLSKDPEHPHSAWENPEPTTFNPLGRLALITPELVKRAASEEIRTGERFSLDLSIESEGFTLFGRKKAERTVKRIDKCAKTKEETEKNGELWFPKHDDLIHINTQVSLGFKNRNSTSLLETRRIKIAAFRFSHRADILSHLSSPLTEFDSMGWTLPCLLPWKWVLLRRSDCRRCSIGKRFARNGSLGRSWRNRRSWSTHRLREMGT